MDKLNDNAILFIQGTVIDYMRRGNMFTSLDIANQAKAAGFHARNRHVAEWLRSNVIAIAHDHSLLYDASLIRVDSKKDGMTLAHVYHYYTDDTDDYLDRDQNPKSFHHPNIYVSPVNPSVVTAIPNAVVSGGSDVRFFTSRQLAREFARDSNGSYKFKDQGRWSNSTANERWSCVKNIN